MDAPPTDRSPPSRAASMAASAATFLFFVACIGTPFVLMPLVGTGWAAVAGIALPILWLTVMPTTCWDGGLIWSLLGMQMVMLVLGWTVFGVALLFSSVF